MYLKDLISRLGGEAIGEVPEALTGVGTIDGAGPRNISFLSNPKYRSALAGTSAAAVIVALKDRDLTTLPRIVTDNPYAYFARVAQLFSPVPSFAGGVHPGAVIHPGARTASSAFIAEFASIGANTTIGIRHTPASC